MQLIPYIFKFNCAISNNFQNANKFKVGCLLNATSHEVKQAFVLRSLVIKLTKPINLYVPVNFDVF